MLPQVVILLDGGFVRLRLADRLGHFPSATEIVTFSHELMKKPRLQNAELLRVHYYDAPPYAGRETNPIDRSVIDFSTTKTAKRCQALLDSLELQEDFAVRRGTVKFHGWRVGSAALQNLTSAPRALQAGDLVPHIEQKGVDLRIGLDIAWIAGRGKANILVLVTGDSDIVPAMKFARQEELRVYLETMGHGVSRELKAHCDCVF